MQYAQIVPNIKTDFKQTLFTYKIPASLLPEVKIGSLVKIPFGNRKILGLVFDIKRKRSFKIQNLKLKSIVKIVVSDFEFPTQLKKLSLWISNYYHVPLSQVIFALLPKPVLKPRAKISTLRKPQKLTDKDLIFKTKLIKFIELIEKTQTKNKQSIVLFGDVENAKLFYQYLPKRLQNETILYHSQLPNSEKWQNYLKILSQKAKVVVGSQIAVFTPLANLGQIIIDGAENQTYKQDRSPRYDTRRVAEQLCQLQKANLFFYSPSLNLDYFLEIKKRKISWLKPQLPFSPKTKLIDMNLEYLNKNLNLLSDLVQQKIIENFRNHQTSILFINKKGSASVVLCRDCQHIFRCPKCQKVLTFRIQYGQVSQALICHHCQYFQQITNQCPNCLGSNLRFLGGGTEKVATEVQKIIPEAKILRLESDHFEKINLQNLSYDLIIGTQQIFSKIFQPANLVVAVEPDLTLNLPDFKSAEKTYQLLKIAKLYAKNEFLVQTHYPQHLIYQAILRDSDQLFYHQELLARKKSGYPPFGKLIRLILTDSNLKHLEEKAMSLVEKIQNSDSSLKILGSSPCFKFKKAEKFCWQIILKGTKIMPVPEVLPKDIKIEVDPVSLL